MTIPKAVITAAGPDQRRLPLQAITQRDGRPAAALQVILGEVLEAGIDAVAVIVAKGDVAAYTSAAGPHAEQVTFIEQETAAGYADAVSCARGFIGGDAFLLMVSDHLYLSHGGESCVKQLLDSALQNECSVSAVQATHESQLPLYGAIGGTRVAGTTGLYDIRKVLEKPTPTLAEQHLNIPGLRAAQYLCFFGMHVLTAGFLDRLEGKTVTEALQSVADSSKLLAFETDGRRFNLDEKNGLLIAQLAIALNGPERESVLTSLVDLLATSRN